MAAELTREVRALFGEGANFVHLATTMPDGSPHSVAVWTAVVENDRIAVFTQATSQKARNMERDPRVALSVVEHENPYNVAAVRGRYVERIDEDAALEVMDTMSHRFTGAPFPYRRGSLYLIEPERVHHSVLAFDHTPAKQP